MIPLKIQNIVKNDKPLSLRILKHLDKDELILSSLNREKYLFEVIEVKIKHREVGYLKKISALNEEIAYLSKKLSLRSNYDDIIKELDDKDREILRLKRICNEHFVQF